MWVLSAVVIAVVHVQATLVLFAALALVFRIPRLRVPSWRLALALESHVWRLLRIAIAAAILQRRTHIVIAALLCLRFHILLVLGLIVNSFLLFAMGAWCMDVNVHPRRVAKLVVELERHLVLSLRPLLVLILLVLLRLSLLLTLLALIVGLPLAALASLQPLVALNALALHEWIILALIL